MYQIEHNELFASIRSGEPINDGEWMAQSTLMGIMGRMAAYTGQEITWEQAMNSQEKLVPDDTRLENEARDPHDGHAGRHEICLTVQHHNLQHPFRETRRLFPNSNYDLIQDESS